MDGENNSCHPKINSRPITNYNKVAETSSPDIVSLKITCSETQDKLNEKTDKNVFLSNSHTNNICDNGQNSSLYTSAVSNTSSCDNKLSSKFQDHSENFLSCD